MGQPAECEYADSRGSGDTLQHVRTPWYVGGGGLGLGVAYWRKSLNTPMWFDATTHYALTSDGRVSWIGEAVDPPIDAAVVRTPRSDH